MKRIFYKKIVCIMLSVLGIFSAWAGMFYGIYDADCLRPIGIIIALLGYCVLPFTVYYYEILCEE